MSGVPRLTETVSLSPTAAAGTRLSRPLYPVTWITRNARAPLLSAHLTMAPDSIPLEIRALCATAPLATSARPFALAAMLLLLHFFYDDEGDGFADGAAFGYSDAFAFFYGEAWGVVSVEVAVSSFVSFEFRYVELIVASYYHGFVHFGAYHNAVEHSPSYGEGSVEWTVAVVAGFLRFFECKRCHFLPLSPSFSLNAVFGSSYKGVAFNFYHGAAW